MGLSKRTFGLEIEMCNFDKEKVLLPNGYSWSKTERIFNTNAKTSNRFGGEVNTPPLFLCQKDRQDVRQVYSSLINAGGVLKWSIATHVHIYAGDLNLEQLKNVFLFLYHCYRYIKKYCSIPDWDEKIFNAKPICTEEHYRKVKQASSLNELNNVFVNQSDKHYLRLAINIASFFVRETIEFRCFNATDNFSLVENCVLASYRMFQYSINNSEDDFKEIVSYDDFLKKLKLPSRVPPILTPLIYQGNPYSPIDSFLSSPLKYNSKFKKLLLEQNITEICIVGDLDYSFALSLHKYTKVSIYTQNPFIHLLWLLSTGKKSIKFKNELEWLNQYITNDIISQIILIIFVSKIRSFISQKNNYSISMFNSYKEGISKSISKMERSAQKVVDFFRTVEYHFGNLDDALTEKNTILYQFGHDKKSNGSYSIVKKYSDIELDLVSKDLDYHGLVERIPENVSFYYFSNSPYISNLNKIGIIDNKTNKSAGVTLYSNKKGNTTKACLTPQKEHNVTVNLPPSDLVISDAEKIKIMRISPGVLYELQRRFIKKVDKLSRATFAYIVMYDKYVLGGFGFTLPRGDFADLWQLSDFCTNNNIPRLSKFILLCVKSQFVQRDLSRKLSFLCKKVITYVYTTNSVSMKYRGEYKKDKDLSQIGRLAYTTDLGLYKTSQEIILKYKQLIKV